MLSIADMEESVGCGSTESCDRGFGGRSDESYLPISSTMGFLSVERALESLTDHSLTTHSLTTYLQY